MADEQFEREVEAEIKRALADPAAYAAEQEAIEAAAGAELAAREAGGPLEAVAEAMEAPAPEAEPTAVAPAEPAPPRAGAAPTDAHSACTADDVTALRQFLDADEQCRDTKNKKGWTPLHAAASAGSVACVEELLVRGAQSALIDKDGYTVLHRAVRHPAAVGALQNSAEDAAKALVALDKRGCSALHLAAAAGADQSCALLCEAAAAGDANANALTGKPDKRGQTALMAACNAGYEKVVEALLAAGSAAQVEHVDGNGVSALLLAARRGDSPRICEKLLASGAPIGARSKAGTTALAEASAAPGGESTVQLLLDSAIGSSDGLDALPLRDVATAVHAAAAKGHHQAIRMLVAPYQSLAPPPPPADGGAKAPPPLPKLLLSKFGKAKEAALHAAARAGHAETVGVILDSAAGYEPRLLAKCIEAVTTSNESAIVLAIRVCSADCVRAIRQAGAPLTLAAVRAAAAENDEGTESSLFLSGLIAGLTDPAELCSCLVLPPGAAAGEEAPLAAASRLGKEASVSCLLTHLTQNLVDGPATPGLGFGEALRECVVFNHLSTLKVLLKGGAPKAAVLEPDSDGWGLLHVAAFHGGVDTATALLDHRDEDVCWVEVDCAGENGVTALMRSACHGAVEATRFLLDGGADPRRLDADGRGPLHHAASTGAAPNDSLSLLLERGGLSVNEPDGQGCTPLLLAIVHGHIDFAELLLATHGASTAGGTEEVDGRPPPLPALHLAAATHQVGMAALLLKHGADVSAVNTQGETALFCACEATEHAEQEGPSALALDAVLFLLEKAGAAGQVGTVAAVDGSTVLHRATAAAVRALERSTEEQEDAVSPAAGAWLSLLVMLLAHGGGGGELAKDPNGDTALHLLTRCRGPNAAAGIGAWREAVGEEAWAANLGSIGADASLVQSVLGGQRDFNV